MKHKASGIVCAPFRIKLFRLWPDLWIMMNCITWNHDWHSTWNCDSFDRASLVAISLQSKEAVNYSQTGQNDSYFLSCSLITTMKIFSANRDYLKIIVLLDILNSQSCFFSFWGFCLLIVFVLQLNSLRAGVYQKYISNVFLFILFSCNS